MTVLLRSQVTVPFAVYSTWRGEVRANRGHVVAGVAPLSVGLLNWNWRLGMDWLLHNNC